MTLLTIAVPTVPGRLAVLPKLFAKLEAQAKGRAVEILSLLDNKHTTLGAKRDTMIGIAKGKYIAFVDDDDDVSDDYVATLVEAARGTSDCIVFDATVKFPDGSTKTCRYGSEFGSDRNEDVLYRLPNHVCCWRTEVAKGVKHLDITYGEDAAWSKRAVGRVGSQLRIDRSLYTYNYDPAKSECIVQTEDPADECHCDNHKRNKLRIVVARYDEDSAWLSPYDAFVVQKGQHVQNAGREASSYLWYIVQNYERIGRCNYAFSQGRPDHIDFGVLHAPKIERFTWLNRVTQFINEDGSPWGLPVKRLADELGFRVQSWPVGSVIGAAFVVPGSVIRARPLEFWKRAMAVATREEAAPWMFETMWEQVMTAPLCEPVPQT